VSEDQHSQQDPTSQYGQREGQPSQRQSAPGTIGQMRPRPDHGEESYRGCGKRWRRGRSGLR
jgi:hypothetical protein